MKKNVGVNAVLNAIKQCCQILFPLITFPYISRVLGNEGYGIYSFSYSITSYFILLAALGVNVYAIREGAKIRDNKKALNEFCSQVFSINVISSAISLTLLVSLIILSPKIHGYAPYILIQSSAIILATIGTDWVNSIYEDYFYITIRYIFIQTVCLLGMFVFVKQASDIIPYCIIATLASTGGNILNIVYVRRYVKMRFTFNMHLKEHILPLLILFSNTIAISIYVNSDITILGFFVTDGDVGIYSFAAKIYNLIKALINAIVVVSMPRISYILKKEPEKYQKYIRVLFSVISMLLLPVVAGMLFMSDKLIVLAGGSMYLSGNSSLKVLSIATLFAIYASILTNCVLIVNRQEKKCLQATIISALINIGLNFVIIPRAGMIGAAYTTVIAEVINCFLQLKYSRDYLTFSFISIKEMVSYIFGAVVVCFICVLCKNMIQNDVFCFGVAVVLAVLFYGVELLLLKNEYVLSVMKNIRNRGVK